MSHLIAEVWMHARDTAELAAWIAVHSPVLVQSGGRAPQAASEQYWSASKCRLERWRRLLTELTAAADQPHKPATLAWPRVRPVLEEILTSELLTRIWTAAAVAYDAARRDQDLEPIARNIYSGHLDVRRRLLGLMTDARVFQEQEVKALDLLRRRVERWGDMLLAHLADSVPIDEFAFDAERARDFASDLDRDAARNDRDFTTQLMFSSLRASFSFDLADRTPNGDLSRKIGSAILACFGADLPVSTGLSPALWLERISRTASDTEGMIEELLRLDRPVA
ncbi:MAG TPA: hypothetical protein VFB80_06670 [Pirellulaceae bacterium]|nr:hypothetical protein [Pirellulaceae bacterium]